MNSKNKNHEKRYRLLAKKANFDFEVFQLRKKYFSNFLFLSKKFKS